MPAGDQALRAHVAQPASLYRPRCLTMTHIVAGAQRGWPNAVLPDQRRVEPWMGGGGGGGLEQAVDFVVCVSCKGFVGGDVPHRSRTKLRYRPAWSKWPTG